MARIIRNQYQLTFGDGTCKKAIGQSARSVVDAYDTDQLPVVQFTRINVGIEVVEDTDTGVNFTTLVTPPEAITAGCLATPTAFVVQDGSKVIFQAMPVAGFNFVGWFLGGSLLSTDVAVSLSVSAPAIAGQTVQFEARFVAA